MKKIKVSFKFILTLRRVFEQNKSTNVGVSAGSGSVGGSFGQSRGSGEYAETVISSLVGTESVDLNIGGKLSMTGSVIANIDENNKDGGNLKIQAESFEYNDLDDYNRSKQSGFNVGTNIGVGETTESKINRAKGISDTAETFASGSTNIGFNRSGHETEGVTYATIGNGSIVIKDGTDITGLNRDINNTQKTTKDVITGALDVQASIDNRLLSGNGLENIAEDFEDLGINLTIMKDEALADIYSVIPLTDEEKNYLASLKQEILASITKEEMDEMDKLTELQKKEFADLEKYTAKEDDYNGGAMLQDLASKILEKYELGEDLSAKDIETLKLLDKYNQNLNISPVLNFYETNATNAAESIFDDMEYMKLANRCQSSGTGCITLFHKTATDIDSYFEINLNGINYEKSLGNVGGNYKISTRTITANLSYLSENNAYVAVRLAGHEVGGHAYHDKMIRSGDSIPGANLGMEFFVNRSFNETYIPEYFNLDMYSRQPSEKLASKTASAYTSVFDKKREGYLNTFGGKVSNGLWNILPKNNSTVKNPVTKEDINLDKK